MPGPANATTDFYSGLNLAANRAIIASTSDPGLVGKAQQRIAELNRWHEVLSVRAEAVLIKHAVNEATVGLFLLVSGLYRPAFVSLRLFVELCLATVHFSANRLELAEWINGRCDINWSTLIDSQTGVLSVRYADAFFPELRDSTLTYNAIPGKVYRELSEFVHGNHHTWGVTTSVIAFDSQLQSRWLNAFREASDAVTYVLVLRYLTEFRSDEINQVSTSVQDSLGHLEPIRDYLGSRNE